jgi:hypothetical protein
MTMNEFWTMKELGGALGLTSHQVGKRLKQLGLRNEAEKPTKAAFEGGYCRQRWTQDAYYLGAWDADKVLRLLGEDSRRPPEEDGDHEKVPKLLDQRLEEPLGLVPEDRHGAGASSMGYLHPADLRRHLTP